MLAQHQCESIEETLISLQADIYRNCEQGFGGFQISFDFIDGFEGVDVFASVCEQIKKVIENNLHLSVNEIIVTADFPPSFIVGWPRPQDFVLPAAE